VPALSFGCDLRCSGAVAGVAVGAAVLAGSGADRLPSEAALDLVGAEVRALLSLGAERLAGGALGVEALRNVVVLLVSIMVLPFGWSVLGRMVSATAVRPWASMA
jgi:hypothetical protein